MAAVTIRKLPEDTLRALKKRAQQRGRSTEAEMRMILQEAVRPRRGMGKVLAAIGRKFGGLDLPAARKPSPVRPVHFES